MYFALKKVHYQFIILIIFFPVLLWTGEDFYLGQTSLCRVASERKNHVAVKKYEFWN